MHTVHVADETKNGFGYAAMGIIFDTKHYNVKLTKTEEDIIDYFFDSIQLGSDDFD